MDTFWEEDSSLHSFANVKSVQIETIDYCNRKCSWCPNKDRNQSPDWLMDRKTLDRVLDELDRLNFIGRIHPYLNGEPLLDNRILDWISLIRERFQKNIIMISTNGDYLNSKVYV